MKVLGKIFLGISTIFTFSSLHAQTQVFAELQGQPTMNTTGWNLYGSANVGDTPGDADAASNELILTNTSANQNGRAFFAQPINLVQCTKWKAEFEFRIFDSGTSEPADGLMFCFLDAIPSGTVTGGGDLGLPPGVTNGLKIAFDTYNNGNTGFNTGCGDNPEIQIAYGPGYKECPIPSTPANYSISRLNNVGGDLNFIRSNGYNQAVVEYDAGNITVTVTDPVSSTTKVLTAFHSINFTGYVGFSAGTGTFTDRHSVRNVTIYADVPVANAGADVSYCSGSSVQLGTTPDPLYAYTWSPATGLSNANIANPTVSQPNLGTAPITLTYTLTTSLAGISTCSTTDQVVVTVNPVPTSPFTLSKSIICPNEPLTVTYTGSASPTAMYDWNFNGGTVISGSGQGPYQVSWPSQASVQVTLGVVQNACTSSVSTRNLTVRPKPILTITGVPGICLGETANYTGTVDVANSIISWVPGPTGNSVNFSPNITTTYTASATSPNGCVSDDTTFTLTVTPKPVGQINGDAVICKGDSILLTGTSSVPLSTFTWFPIGDTASQVWVSPSGNLTYKLVAAKNGCFSDTAEFLLRVDSVPNLTLPDSLVVCAGQSITVTAVSTTPGTLFDWQPGSLTGSQNTLSPISTTDYEVYAYNETCTSEVKIFTVEVLQSCDCELLVPNIFTPNGDNVNDEIWVQNPQSCEMAQFEFAIMNRWGAVVWKTTDPLAKWDGKCMIGNCTDGTYFWVLNYSFFPGGAGTPEAISEKGILTIAH